MTNELNSRLIKNVTVKDGIRIISFLQKEIDDFNYFEAHITHKEVANNGVVYFYIKPPENITAEMIFKITAEGKAYFESYENITSISGASDLANFNRKIAGERVSSDVEIKTGIEGTVTVIGNTSLNRRFDDLIEGGTGPRTTGETQEDSLGTELVGGNNLLIAVTNASGNTKDITISCGWFERETA